MTRGRKNGILIRMFSLMLAAVLLCGTCITGLQAYAAEDDLFDNPVEIEFDQEVTALCLRFKTFDGTDDEYAELEAELEDLQERIEKEEQISEEARANLLDRLEEYAPEEEEIPIGLFSSGAAPIAVGDFVETKKLSISKTVTAIPDSTTGEYLLELTLSGAQGSVSNKKKLDVVIVIDRSESMYKKGHEDRLTPAKNAATALIDTIESNSNINASYNVVQFGGGLSNFTMEGATGTSGWETAAGAKSYIEDIVAREFTNYEAAFNRVKSVLNGRTNERVVIFLTDGNPTTTTTPYTHGAYRAYIEKYWDNKAEGNVNLSDEKNFDFWCDEALTEKGISQHKDNDGNVIRDSATKNGTGVDDGIDNGTNLAQHDRANVKLCLDAAINVLDDITISRFYAVGCGSVKLNNLQTLANSSKASYKQALKVDNVNSLKSEFEKIALDITHYFCSDVTLTDKLSHTDSESKNPAELLVNIPNVNTVNVVVTDTAGDVKYGPAKSVTTDDSSYNPSSVNRTITASYDKSTQTMTMDFDNAYVLEPNLVYKLQAVIEPTETAYEQYRWNILNNLGKDGYPNVGEPLTGTHQNEFGISSNDEAIVTYKYESSNKESLPYPHPVVRLHPGTLVITKDVVSDRPLTEDQLKEIRFNIELTFPDKLNENGELVAQEPISRELSLGDAPEETITTVLDAVSFSNPTTAPKEDGSYTYSFSCTVPYLSPNTKYKVTEVSNKIDDFDVTSYVNGEKKDALEDVVASGTILRDKTVTEAFTNEYERSTTSLTVTKEVTGNMGDWSKDFTFTASVKDPSDSDFTMNGLSYTKYTGTTEESTGVVAGDTATFTLKHDQKIVFHNVPMKAVVTIDEAVEGTEYDAYINGSEDKSVNGVYSGTVPESKDGLTVPYVNDYEENIGTGVVTDSMPMVILFVLSFAGAVMLFSRKRRVE